jgi:hypothetical protein
MTLNQFIESRLKKKKKNKIFICGDDFAARWNLKAFQGAKTRAEMFEWVAEETAHLTDEALVTMYVTAKMTIPGSAFYAALQWSMYSRDIPFETVNVQNPAVVQASDPVSPDLPEEPNRV